MTRTGLTGTDVDTDQLVQDLKSLAFEVDEGFVFVDHVSTEQSVETEGREEVSVTVTFKTTTDSIFSGGYRIPYEE